MQKAYQGCLTIVVHEKIAKDTYVMVLEGSGAKYITKPGQFINIKINDGNDPFLRRPISVSEYSNNKIKIVYKVVGKGTKLLSQKMVGDKIDCLIGLGNGFDIPKMKKALLIGGGIGVPPLYELAKQLHEQKTEVTTVMGFTSAEDVFFDNEFEKFGKVIVTTNDGSYKNQDGSIKKGLVTDVINGIESDYYFACGPTNMLKAIKKTYKGEGYLSLEERMACGIGACMGCSIKTINGPKRVCVEGPVFLASEVFLDD